MLWRNKKKSEAHWAQPGGRARKAQGHASHRGSLRSDKILLQKKSAENYDTSLLYNFLKSFIIDSRAIFRARLFFTKSCPIWLKF